MEGYKLPIIVEISYSDINSVINVSFDLMVQLIVRQYEPAATFQLLSG
jgi:hypothetical protein